MSRIQLEAFGELFQSKKAINRFKKKNYSCPFDSRIDICDKPNRSDQKYGNCIVQVGDSKRIVCPRRFYEGDFNVLRNIKNFIFRDDKVVDCYMELGVQKRTEDAGSFTYGTLDWILVNRVNTNDFCGVEIQSDSTTGTGAIRKGISDLVQGNLQENYSFGLNTLASFKGFLPQFIFKGQLFDDWNKPYCAVMQDELWERFTSKFRIRYKEITNYTSETFLFFIYSLEFSDLDKRYNLVLKDIYSSRWIDILFSFSVESELLLDASEFHDLIIRRVNSGNPIVTI